MLKRRLLSMLLALAALFAAAARPCAAVEPEMTVAEEREARALTLHFMERLRETDDFGPLVKEFFPSDFEQRVRQFVGEVPRSEEEDILLSFDRAALLRAEPGELRRAYVALMNFWNQFDRIGDAAFDYARLECRAEGAAEPCGWGRRSRRAREAVPEEALRIAATDPMLEATLGMIGDDSEPSTEAEVDEARRSAAVVRDPARLRSFTDKLERCVVLLREAVAKLRADARVYAAAHSLTKSFEDAVAAREELKVYHLSEKRLEEASFGLPAGARLIHGRVYPFEMAIARHEGRLRILAVYPDYDGD